jgi:3-deoxy-D-manno-octulosonic-acid transferase
VHCSSLGEFEQGRPLIEEIKANYPTQKIVLTFFSPSGYGIRKNYGYADAILYLPLDTPGNAAKFLNIINPKMAIFIKYDFWFNFLSLLEGKKIPYVFVSSKFRKNQYFFLPMFSSLLNKLREASHIFLQDDQSLQILKEQRFDNMSIAGDTRIDRVLSIKDSGKAYPQMKKYLAGKFTLLLGSIWKADMEKVGNFIQGHHTDDIRFILAPHDISTTNLDYFKKEIGRPVNFFSDAEYTTSSNVIIVDTIGDLAFLYQYADLAYIGGGFGEGIHNILEPSAYHIPVIFGPKHTKFNEAVDLIELKGAFCIQSQEAFEKLVNHLRDVEHRKPIQEILAAYFDQNLGATKKIITYLNTKNVLH